jgi:predicted N-acetyltransferase YhbS
LRGCFVAEDDGEIVGYAISVPWIAGKIIALDSFYTIPAAANCLYLRDLCVKLNYRNKGIGRKLAERILMLNTYSRIYLIAVLMTGGFWRQLGFRHVMQIEYGDAPAEYMLLEL